MYISLNWHHVRSHCLNMLGVPYKVCVIDQMQTPFFFNPFTKGNDSSFDYHLHTNSFGVVEILDV